MRVAVASKGGAVVDMHFGHAEEFLIYDVEGEEIRPVGKRVVRPYCVGPVDCDDRALADTMSSLSDCQAVLSSQIGYMPAMELAGHGIKAIVTYDFIEKALADISKGLLKPMIEV